jgi:hypothetical protein
VLLLHDVFDYGYPEIAAIVGKSEGNVRQLATRARRHVEQRRPRFQTRREQRDELARRFFAAAEQGDLPRLEALFAHDVELTGDSGGKVPALARSLRGRNRVARTLISWVRLAARLPGVSLRPVEVNGGPGALFLDGQQRMIGVLALDIADGQITSISSIVNPDKLTHLGPVADFRSLRTGIGGKELGKARRQAGESSASAHTLEHAERPPVNQQPALHLAEGRSRPVILLLRERCGQVLPEPVEMLADDPADLLVARGPMPGVRRLSAGRARHARQRRHPECLFLISKQPGPGSQIVKELVEHRVEGVRLGNPSVSLLHVQNHVDDLAEHLVEGGGRIVAPGRAHAGTDAGRPPHAQSPDTGSRHPTRGTSLL